MSAPEALRVERAGNRLDRIVASWLGCGRRRARELVRTGTILVDGRRLPAAARLEAGATVTLAAEPEEPPESLPSDLEPVVLWRDERILAVDKPAGLHTVLGRSTASAEACLARDHPELADLRAKSGDSCFAHRLDRDTSGVVLAAREIATWRELRRCFSERLVDKHYIALVDGRVEEPFIVDEPLARRRSRVVPAKRGDRILEAETHVVPVEAARRWSLVDVTIPTGVTHQIRAHLALAGHAVLGDPQYGAIPAPGSTRAGQLLHARQVKIEGLVDVTAPIPADFAAAVARLRSEDAG